ncbi:MAG: hypothetical protein JST90_18750 [Bacteroidetes bacterium]|nr:hypothetical protein [Bacteroidota bacterium]
MNTVIAHGIRRRITSILVWHLEVSSFRYAENIATLLFHPKCTHWFQS